MSASLVGSEMCIRDRDKQLEHYPDPSTVPFALESYGRMGRLGLNWLRTCLLYTSDAADDM
eukprot:9874982-Alexandrium_andersonii.AAC.1